MIEQTAAKMQTVADGLPPRHPLYIFELDGTLADITHRLHHITVQDPKDWAAFFAACGDDAPIVPAIETLNRLQWSGAVIEIWTDRSDEAAAQTREWLQRHQVRYQAIRMRPAGDHRPDVELKAEWLARMSPTDRRRLLAVFEDRAAVVSMWRAAGVLCYQVAAGEF